MTNPLRQKWFRNDSLNEILQCFEYIDLIRLTCRKNQNMKLITEQLNEIECFWRRLVTTVSLSSASSECDCPITAETMVMMSLYEQIKGSRSFFLHVIQDKQKKGNSSLILSSATTVNSVKLMNSKNYKLKSMRLTLNHLQRFYRMNE